MRKVIRLKAKPEMAPSENKASGENKEEKPRRSKSTCWICGKEGHISLHCPSKKNTGGAAKRETRSGLYVGDSDSENEGTRPNARFEKAGTVGGVPVTITIDTGASRTLVRRDLVPEESIRRDEPIGIICAHGDEKAYPTAEVEVRVEGERFTVVAGVVETLPAAVLLGKDVGDLDDLVKKKDFACVLITRQRARAEAVPVAEQERKEAECGATPTTLDLEEATEVDASVVADEIDSQEASDGDEDDEFDAADGEPGGDPFRIYPLPTGESNQPGSGGEERQTRSQRREERSQWKDQVGLGVDREGFRKLQEDDPSLAKIRREAIDNVGKAVVGQFYRQEGLLYRRWVERGSGEEDPLVAAQAEAGGDAFGAQRADGGAPGPQENDQANRGKVLLAGTEKGCGGVLQKLSGVSTLGVQTKEGQG